MVKVSPSILGASLKSIDEVQLKLDKISSADYLHVDVMDGDFVPQRTIFNQADIMKVFTTNLELEAHLMISDPDRRYLEFMHAGFKRIIFHVEASLHPEVTMANIHAWGGKAGLAINPHTSLDRLLPYLSVMDFVLVMGVVPGKSGQKFMPSMLKRILEIKLYHPEIEVCVDGGVNLSNAEMIVDAGCDVLVADTAIDPSKNTYDIISKLHRLSKDD